MEKLDTATEYKVAYSDAMYACSWMENQLCELLANLLGCTEDVAAKVFFNMDYRRYKVMSELIEEKHNEHYAAWKKLKKWITDEKDSISNRRNKLAHWRLVPNMDNHSLANPQKGSVRLWEMARGESSIEDNMSIDDIKAFTSDALLLAELINQFHCCMSRPDYEKGFEVFLDVKNVRKASDFVKRMEEFRERSDKKEASRA